MNFEDTIIDIFKVPAMSIETTIDVQPLLNFTYDLKSKDEGRHFSNVSGWQSLDLDRDLNVFKEFRSTVETLANQFHNNLKLKKCYTQTLDNFWMTLQNSSTASYVVAVENCTQGKDWTKWHRS